MNDSFTIHKLNYIITFIHMLNRRFFSTSAKTLGDEIKNSVKLHYRPKEGGTTFDKSFPKYEKKSVKPWDEQNVSKDDFFRKKYSFIGEKRREELNDKVQRQRRHRDHKRESEVDNRSRNGGNNGGYTEKLRIPKNPLNEYVYGTHAVLAALSSNKRQLFNTLYVQNIKTTLPPIIKLARQFNLKIQDKVPKDVLNSLTSFGVHNGIVLETKPLEFPMVSTLGPCDSTQGTFQLAIINELYNTIEPQEKEVARLQKDTEEIGGRYPLGIYLDGLMDPRNVGAIVRSAFFFGADFVVVPDSESAKLGPVTCKSSAGALEMLNIYKTSESLKFIEQSRRNGWAVISATVNSGAKNGEYSPDQIKPEELSSICDRVPVLLVMGSEGLGVRTNLIKRSDYIVGINQHRVGGSGIVDSLNASVAAALLISKCVE